jgi:2-dehydro-3-deoxygluconokinase
MALAHNEIPGSLEHATTLSLSIGGAESNVAIGARRLGATSAWIGRVGRDSLGRRVVREIRAEGVTVFDTIDDVASTGLMVKERRTSATSRVMYYRSNSAGSRLCVDDLPAEEIASAKILHVTGITPSLSASARDAVFAAIDIARAHAVTVSLDLNHRSALWRDGDPRALYGELAARCDIIFANVDEASLLVPAFDDLRDLARRLQSLGPREVILKLGDQGALALVDHTNYLQPALTIVPVDTVGAGDGFVAGYLVETLRGSTTEARLDLACRVGAFACLASGDWESLPRREDLALLDVTDPVSR